MTHAEEFSGQIAILENVPARVCKQCGDGLFRPEVVEKIQQLIWSAVTPNRMSQVPVYDLSETPPVEESQLDLAWSSEFPFSTQSIDSNAQNAPGVYEILQRNPYSLQPDAAAKAEKALLKNFEDIHWDLPVLNSQRGYARGEDNHYRSQ